MKLKLLFLYFLVNSTLLCFGQSGKLFSTDLELSSSLIMDVYQDKRGIIWIATEDGLNRYDGSKFVVYKHDKKNKNSLLNNYVRLVFEDRKANFFIGYYNGLQMYDYATDNFKEIPFFGKNNDRVHPHIITMVQRRTGDILIGTAGLGLFLVEFKGKEIQARYLQSAIPTTLINLLFEDKDENLWVSTEDKGLFKIDKKGSLRNYFGGKEMPNTIISSLCQDKQGNLYGGSLSSGMYTLDKEKDTFFAIPYPPNQNLPIKTLYMSEQNQIYIGTDGFGMKIYDADEKKIIEKNFNVTTFDFTKSKVHAITEDNKGNIWVGLFQKGVMLLPPKINNFKYLGYKSISENLIGSNNIMSVFKDHEGILWVGTDNDGIYGIGTDGKRKAHFVHTNEPNSVPSTIMCIYEDSEHNLWIGSYFNGLGKLNRKTGSVDYLRLYDNNSNIVRRIYALIEDKEQNLWIASMGSGLFSLNLRSGKIAHFADGLTVDGQKKLGFLHNNWINCLTITKDNKLFIGTYDGLGCLDLRTKSFVSSFGANHLLTGHIVYSIYEDYIGNLWLGTAEGLTLLEKNTKKLSTYSTDDGLPSNVICAIKGDQAGNLWMSTNYGISKMNLRDSSFNNFYSNDGLQSNEFSKTAACIGNDGQIFFGGINGITYFYPSEVKDLEKKLEVRLTDFYIHDKPVKKGMKSDSYEIISTSVMEATEFNLSHHDNSFSIEFSTLEFNNPERITYLYSLNNQDWINLSPGTNRVTFSDLAPGS